MCKIVGKGDDGEICICYVGNLFDCQAVIETSCDKSEDGTYTSTNPETGEVFTYWIEK